MPSLWTKLLNAIGPGGRQTLAKGVSGVGRVLTAPYRASERMINPPRESFGSVYDLMSPVVRSGLTPEAVARLQKVPVQLETKNMDRPQYNWGRDSMVVPPGTRRENISQQTLLHEGAHAIDPINNPRGLMGQTALGRRMSSSLGQLLKPGSLLKDMTREQISGLPGKSDYFSRTMKPADHFYWLTQGPEERMAMTAGRSLYSGVPEAAQGYFSRMFTKEWMNPGIVNEFSPLFEAEDQSWK